MILPWRRKLEEFKIKNGHLKLLVVAALLMLLAAPLTLLAAEEPADEITLGAGGSAAEPYEFSLLVGDQY